MKAALKQTALAAVVLMAGLAACLAWGFKPEANAGPVILAAGILLLGFAQGTLAAWAAGVCCGLLTLGLYLANRISLDLALGSLGAQVVCTLFPLPWVEAEERAKQDFQAYSLPLEQEREELREELAQLQATTQAAERRSRETDALYHAGREISKLLSLQDTLEFSKEVLRDTLRPLSGDHSLPFVLALVDEESASFKVGAADGLSSDEEQIFEHRLDQPGLLSWLKTQAGPVSILKTAAEPALKGIPLPIGVRGLAAFPLVIQALAIGWVVVFDMGEGRMEDRDFSNLRILCSQIAIGLEKATLYDKVQRLSITDGLTGLTVHRHFQARLDEELKRAERFKEPLGLVMLDIDHFKRFNDTYGHLVGDAVLRAVAGVLKKGLGPAELAARYGGEEFALILPRLDRQSIAARAEAVRQAVSDLSVDHNGQALKVTVSLGVACFPEDAMTKKGLVELADQALYQSKKNGRDRVTLAQSPVVDTEPDKA
jgi:diguanylate cyclase (GGDEF)-like protein